MENEFLSSNQGMWDELVRIHARGDTYDLPAFKQGKSSLHALELGEVGEVAGKRLLHLQCHFGKDSLSWARQGAQVTAMDFSPEGIALAQSLSQELNIPARFLCCNLYDLPSQLDPAAGQFDVVYTSYGVLTWLPDRRRWAQIAASYVKPGGFFYIAEFHPFTMVFSETAFPPVVEFTYFDEGAIAWPVQGSYADRTAVLETKTSYEWNYPLGEVVSLLAEAGLRIEYLHEWDYSVYQQFPYLQEGADGHYRLPPGSPRLPLMFSWKATKPEK